MDTKFNKIACKVIGWAGYISLTLFAIAFAISCVGVFIVAMSESDIFSLIVSALCGFASWMCWSVRKGTLV